MSCAYNSRNDVRFRFRPLDVFLEFVTLVVYCIKLANFSALISTVKNEVFNTFSQNGIL